LLQYFRINDPYRLLGLLAIFFVISLPLFIDTPDLTYPELKGFLIGEKVHEGASLYTAIVDSTGPLAGWVEGLLNVLFGRSIVARHIISFVLIFLQAAYIGVVFSKQKAFAEQTYIPSLIYVIAFGFSYDTLALTPELLGAGALLPAISSLFKEIEFREQRSESIFSLGLYISIASLFSFSYSVLLIGSFITLAAFTRSNVRKYLLLIVGFALPHLMLLAIYYLKDGLSAVWQFYYVANFTIHSVRYISSGGLWTLLTLPLIYLVVSIVLMNREARLSKYQTQLVQAMLFWTLFSLVQVYISRDFRPQNFVSVIPGLCFFVTHFLLIMPKRKFAEIAIWIFIGGTVLISNLTRYGVLGSVNYRDLIVRKDASPYTNQRLLVLDEGWEIYSNNRLASPFLDWNLSRSIFTQPEYYENVIMVSNGFKNDPPAIIRDRHNMLQPYLERLPELRKQYKRQGEYYLLIKQ